MITLDDFAALSPWAWIIFGIIFCGAELAFPGAFLLWIGMAAIAAGIVDFFVPFSGAWGLILFAGFALAFMLIGQRFYGSMNKSDDDADLNNRSDKLIGREFTLDQPIAHGLGRIRVDDSVWRVKGPDLPTGARVRVAAVENGVELRVEQV